ncbi:cytidylate kinase-like family protein [Clostridium boliviensis]|uniref:Cytidylate kinase-like family protein n=1 Tax=Clostridium boliviensis TaxID=318465 RepID=A0ABU4GJJ4_9CLOT|nr:cytidylate kinase-like family protein [Clostridium boliviensis]MDW2797128.1 cytidylate kinase-like family protein [Clostridium boliviensis]
MKEKSNLVITIGRQYGSGGRIVGKALAEELGIHFYDEEILTITSEQSAVGEVFFRLADEKAGNNLLYRIVSGLKPQLGKPSTDADIVKPENLFRFQSQVIKELANEESCIIAGRCANYILDRDEENVPGLVKIFVYADTPTLIQRTMEVDKIDEKEAAKRVKKINKERKEYYRYYTGENWEDWNNYDLIINTSRIDLEQTARLIKDYIKLRGIEV